MRRLIVVLLLSAAFFVGPASAAVNLNTADASELESLPGIGASKAAAIIQYRTDHGPFTSVEDLDNVAGIGPATLASLRELVVVGAAGAGGTSPAGTSLGNTPAPSTGPTDGGGAPSSLPAAPPPAGCPVNINLADAAGLDALPGIGASKAAAILQYRQEHGNFSSCDDLDAVSGIGAATIDSLRTCCTVK